MLRRMIVKRYACRLTWYPFADSSDELLLPAMMFKMYGAPGEVESAGKRHRLRRSRNAFAMAVFCASSVSNLYWKITI